ncbi:MAG: hypothetical protein HYY03_08015 [Chloroflexi bacterium]|nr:hypothetical protein [Chloroflexota bacterium]
MRRTRLALALGILVLAVVAATGAWLTLDGGRSARPAAASPKKVIYMSAVEYKGGTSSEPFPATTPPPGGGYLLKPPDTTGRWETSTYRWEPGTVLVNEGDEVELWIWGVNGSSHPSHIEEYVPQFTVTRGQLTVVSFTADKVGTFKIHCSAHQPSMEALLVVLPSAAAVSTPTPTASPTLTAAGLPSAGGSLPESQSSWPVIVLAAGALVALGGLLMVARRRRQWW